MLLDSVRGLKLSLSDSIRMDMSGLSGGSHLSIPQSARAIAKANLTPPTFALGVSRRSRREFSLAVRVQNKALMGSAALDRILAKAKGEVDVKFIGRIEKRALPWQQKKQRPLLIGSSVAHEDVTAGTLGFFAKSRSNGKMGIVSNNHVLANENEAKRGDAILQPGFADIRDKDESTNYSIATLANYIKISDSAPNLVDAAFAVLNEGVIAKPDLLKGLGKLNGLGDEFLDFGLKVSKIGRTTGLTQGRVTAFELDHVAVQFDFGLASFDSQIEIESSENRSFSQGGDSGSLIVDENLQAVALLFAGSDFGGSNGRGKTFANPIRAVTEALKVDIALN